MAGNHGFPDGNKRTTLLLVDMLVERSGYCLVPLSGEEKQTALENAILASVERKMTIDDLVAWFKLRLKPLRPPVCA
jgi:death on curing protein